ncbi:hypothetical protein ACQ4PT_069913 [Festuca glaucescens]
MEAVSTILKLAQQIAKAAETARRNRARCRHLADRALTIGDNLRDFEDAGASGDTASRRSALGRHKAALDDALKLVESRRRQSRWLSWLASGRTAARFQDADGRITACVVDLGLVKLLHAGAQGRPPANTRAGSWKKKETDRSGKKKKDGPKNGGAGNNSNKGKTKDIGAKNGNKSGGAAASNQKQKKKGGGQQGWNGSRQVKGKPAAAPVPRRCAAHSMEDDPGSCSVM